MGNLVASPAVEPAAWTSLPPEILQLIACKLTNICDYIRFRCVCTAWRCSAPSGGYSHRQVPWLVFPWQEDSHTLLIFNPSDRRFYEIPLPEEPRVKTYIHGSAHGWLPLTNFHDHGGEIALFNPITRAHIRLPLIPTDLIRRLPLNYISKAGQLRIYRVLLCCNPAVASPHQLLVAIWTNINLLIYRQGDDNWVHIDKRLFFSDFGDIAYVESEATLYAVDVYGRPAVLDLAAYPVPQLRLLTENPSPEIIGLLINWQLVVTADGDILVLSWDKVDRQYVVLRLDRKGGSFKWAKATDGIGDNMLFVCRTEYVSAVPGPGFTDGQANQIYVFNDRGTYSSEHLVEIHPRIAVLDVRDGVTSSERRFTFETSERKWRSSVCSLEDFQRLLLKPDALVWFAWMVPSLS